MDVCSFHGSWGVGKMERTLQMLVPVPILGLTVWYIHTLEYVLF